MLNHIPMSSFPDSKFSSQNCGCKDKTLEIMGIKPSTATATPFQPSKVREHMAIMQISC